jgi:hypothetical protein
MEDKRLEDLSIKELKARLEAITKERGEIVALIQDAASVIGFEPIKPAAPKTRKSRMPKAVSVPRSGGTTENKVKAALAGGKVMATGELVAALVKDGANKGTATQFLYSKLGKKMLQKTDAGWKLKG